MKGVPFLNRSYTKGLPFLSTKNGVKKGKGLDLRAQPPLSTPSRPYTGPAVNRTGKVRST